MVKERNLKLNMLINSVRTLFSVLFPLITFPYISRVLEVNDIGAINFSNSIVNYFLLLSGLGISTYAVREGTQYRNNRNEMNKFYSEMMTINIISTVISFLLLIILIFHVDALIKYKLLILIASMSIFTNLLGAEWMMQIYEEYLYLAVRYIIVHFIAIVAMFVFVKNSNDYVVYLIISVLSTSGVKLLNLKKLKELVNYTFSFSFRHIKPILILFASNIATMIFTSSDITILGLICGDREVGLYSVSVKIYNLLISIMGAFIATSIPRVSYCWGNDKFSEAKNIIDESYSIVLTILIPLFLGSALLSKEIILVISGEKYIEASTSLLILSLAFACCIIGYFCGDVILIPKKREGIVLISTVIAAVSNLVLNFCIIPIWQQNAAALTTFFAQFIGLIIVFYYSIKELPEFLRMHEVLLKIIPGSLAVVFICVIAKILFSNPITIIAFSVILSVTLYFIIELLVKNQSVYSIYSGIKRKYIMR